VLGFDASAAAMARMMGPTSFGKKSSAVGLAMSHAPMPASVARVRVRLVNKDVKVGMSVLSHDPADDTGLRLERRLRSSSRERGRRLRQELNDEEVALVLGAEATGCEVNVELLVLALREWPAATQNAAVVG
jgi:hypothetical protein